MPFLTATLRHLRRTRGYALINILGLAIGMACTLLIYLYVDFEYSWDHFRPNADRIYRVLRKGPTPYGPQVKPFEGTAGALGPALVREFPEVEETCRIRMGAQWARVGDFALRTPFWRADPNVLDYFGFKLARGDAATALSDPGNIILNPAIVETFFGDEDPMGKVVEGQHRDFVVTGILEPLPRNSMIQFNFLIAPGERIWDGFERGPRQRRTITFIRLREGADPKALEAKLVPFARTILPESEHETQTYLLQALTRMRMHGRTDFPEGIDGLASGMGAGNVRYVRTLLIIGGAVLLIACINFMNLATAQASLRAKEIGVRKAVGATRRQLAVRFLGESLVLSAIALPAAWLIVELVSPAWNDFIGATTPLDPLDRPRLVGGIAAIVLAIGLLAGSYPALYLSGLQPSRILRGLAVADRTALIRKGLVVAQFAIAVVLVIGSAVAWRQVDFVTTADLGFEREDIITLSFFDVNGRLRPQYREIKARLADHPDVVGVFASASRPGEGWTRDRRRYAPPDRPDMDFELSNYSVDEDFFDALGIEILEGRNFSLDRPTDRKSAYILNETAVRKLGIKDPVGKPFSWKEAEVTPGYGRADVKEGYIIGVVRDFHARRLTERITPSVFALDPSRFRIVSVKTKPGRLLSTMDHLETVWKQYIDNRPLHHYFLDDRLDRAYRNHHRYQRILALSFGLAISVACLGLTGLAAHTAERRTKEIGIRKSVGASTGDIVRLLSGEFLRVIAVANLVAWPFAWRSVSQWLEGFAYRVDVTPWPFLLAAALSLLFAAVTVGYQALRAARTDPVEALRYE